MSKKYPRNIIRPDRPHDFSCPGYNCILLLWRIDNCFYGQHADSTQNIDPDEKYSYLARRTKRGKWVWTYNTRPDIGYGKQWITLTDHDDVCNIPIATNIEHAYQDWILSIQIENSLTENNIE
jgi:hypothetical protein